MSDPRDARVQSLILAMAESLVYPEPVTMTVETQGSHSTLRLSVPPGSLGKVIGKGGRIARAMRVILQSISTAGGTTYALDILEA